MTTRRQEIVSIALKILKSNSNGIHYSELVRKISEECPHIPINTIHGNVWDLGTELPDEVYKPAKGIFRHVDFKDKEIKAEEIKQDAKHEKVHEDMFYKPFAEWLVN
jgi:hypothetical protein